MGWVGGWVGGRAGIESLWFDFSHTTSSSPDKADMMHPRVHLVKGGVGVESVKVYV